MSRPLNLELFNKSPSDSYYLKLLSFLSFLPVKKYYCKCLAKLECEEQKLNINIISYPHQIQDYVIIYTYGFLLSVPKTK